MKMGRKTSFALGAFAVAALLLVGAIDPRKLSIFRSGVVMGRVSAGSGPLELLNAADVSTLVLGAGTLAPSGAKYITQTADATLTAEQALGLLSTGILKSTTTTGVLSIAVNSDLPVMTSTVGGAVPTPPNDVTYLLRGDGTWLIGSGVAWGGITGTLSAQTDLQTALNLKAPLASPTFTGTVTMPTPFTLGATSVTPSGAELNFVDGVTSGIQGQIDGKQASDAQLTSVAALTYAGNTLKVMRVNAGETDFELVTLATGGRYLSKTIYTSSSGSHVTGASTTLIHLRMVGGGGGGGGGDGAAMGLNAGCGGGGGSGVYNETWIAVSPSTGYSYVVGAGGAGGAAGPNAGSAGATSTFSFGTYTAPGGSGGQSLVAAATIAYVSGGAAGAGGVGDVVAGGNVGGLGYRSNALNVYGGGGAPSFYGGGGSSGALSASPGSVAGGNATAHGAGGGGGAVTGNPGDVSGGNGLGGIIIIEEYS